MRRILRRYLTRDPAGRPISDRSERLTDDGTGRLQLHSEQATIWCSGCRRPLVELSELRGACDWCHHRGCCVHCLAKCAVCARRLCGNCRQGFGGPPTLTVCAVCRQRLIDRQQIQDQLTVEQTAFDRHQAQQRLFLQAEGLRLNAERLQLMAQFQQARLNAGRRTKLQWAGHLLGVTAATAFNGVKYVIRRALP